MTQILDNTGKGLVSRIIRRLEKRLKPEKITKTLRVHKEAWAEFEEVCRKLTHHPADVLNLMIEEFLEDYQATNEKIRQNKGDGRE